MRKHLRTAWNRTYAIVSAPVKATGRFAQRVGIGIRNYFKHPSIEQLVSADFGMQFGLAFISFVYAIGFMVVGMWGWALAFIGIGSYYSWLLVKMQPWWTKMIGLARLEDAFINSGLDAVPAAA